MANETYISFKEYIESTSGAVLLFVLCDTRGREMNRQVVPYKQLVINSMNKCAAKFIVDEQLSSKMIPGEYKLYLYVGIPSTTAKEAKKEAYAPEDYTLDKCLTEQGVRIRVRGGLNEPSLGTEEIV